MVSVEKRIGITKVSAQLDKETDLHKYNIRVSMKILYICRVGATAISYRTLIFIAYFPEAHNLLAQG